MSRPRTSPGSSYDTPGGGPLRVLLVEDSENDAMLLLRELRRGGYEPVHERVDTPEAMERALDGAKERGEPWDIVLSDYFMPRFRGPDALSLLRRLGYDTPFIVVSGKLGEETAVEMMRAGAHDYVAKENLARLNPAIERELREAETRRERERIEEALSRSENRFQRLVEQAADAVFVYDLDGRFVDVNRRACESLGYSREELRGMSVPDIEIAHDPEVLARVRAEIVAGEPRTIEGVQRRKDGTTFPVEVSVGLLEAEGADGDRLMVAFARDITERKEAERKVREAETRYRTLVEQIPAVTYVQEPLDSANPKAVTYMSPQYEAMLGYPRETKMLDEEHWLKVLHPEDRERVLAEEVRTDESGEPFDIEYRVIAADGRVVWVRDQAVLVRDEAGKPLYWQGVQYDITGQKRIEEDLRGSEDRYRTFIEQSTEGIWRYELEEPLSLDASDDEQLEHIYRHTYLAECNDAMARMYGYERAEELIGTRLDDLLPRSVPENIEYLRTFARAGHRLTDAETREFDRDGNLKFFLNNLTGMVEDGYLVRAWGTQRDITESKLAEEELRRSEKSLAEAQRIAHIGNWDYDPSSDEAHWSDELYRIFGFTPQEFVPTYRTFLDLVHPDDRGIVRAEIRRALYGQHHSSIDYRIVRPDGEERFVNTRYEVIRDDSGLPISLTGTIHDITERKQAEEAIQRAEEKYRSIFENSVDGIFQTSLDGRILTANPSLARMLGYESPEELMETVTDVGRQVYADPDKRDEFVHALRERGSVSGFEMRARRKDGSLVWLSLSARLLVDQNDGLNAFEGTAEDITERKRAEEALQRSEMRFRTVIEQSPLSIQILSPDGYTLRVNRAWEELWGATIEGLAGYNLLEDPQLEAKGVMGHIRRGFAGEPTRIPPIVYETEASIPGLSSYGDHRRWVQAFIYPVRDASGSIREVVLVHEDVTERHRAEEELARLASYPLLNPNPIVETSVAGEPTYLNPAAREHFPSLVKFGSGHPALAGLGEIWEEMEVSGRPFTREVRVGESFYQQTISRVPDSDLLRIYAIETTERRRAEDAVRESEERFRALVQNASDIIVVLDAEGKIIYESGGIERILGYGPEERVGRSAFSFIHPDDVERVRRSFAEFMAGSGPRPPVEYRVRARNGEWRSFEAIGSNLLDDPAVGGIVVNARDVTERKRAEEERLESETRFRATFDQAAVGVALVGLGGEWLRVNQKLCDIVGYAANELIELTFQDITHPDDLRKDLDLMESLVAGEISTYSMEKRYLRKDGSVIWINLTASAVRDASGRPEYFISVIEDIGERKRAEEALQQSEALYRTVVEQAAENIFVVDAASKRILEVNAALHRSLGYTPEELQRMTLYDLVAHDRGSIDENTERILEEGRYFLGERRYRRRDGTLVDVEVSVSAISYGGRDAMCIVAHDITERKRTEQAMQEVREAERNRIARDLHDDILQNLVYALQEIQILQVTSENGGDPALEDTADALRRSVEGLRAAIFELRLNETLDRSFATSMQTLLELNRRMARKRYEIDVSVSDDFPESLPERKSKELLRIIQEAMTNARRHAAPDRVRIELGARGDLAFAEITDDGRGFDPAASGGGVGMASMRRRTQDLGGEIHIHSAPGEGTRVRFEIPVDRLTGE